MPATTSSPCALTRNSPQRPRSPVDGVAAEADAGAGAVALVAEDHLHDVHGGAEVVGDPVGLAIDARAGRVPGVEDGTHRAQQLLVRVLRERRARCALVDVLVPLDQLGAGRRRRARGRRRRTARGLQRLERVLEAAASMPVDDLAVHLDEPPVRVVREPRVRRCAREAARRPRRSGRGRGSCPSSPASRSRRRSGPRRAAGSSDRRTRARCAAPGRASARRSPPRGPAGSSRRRAR